MVLHAPTLAHVTAHEHRPLNRTLAAALFVVIYAMAGSYAVRTAGEPYAAALKEQERLDALKNATKANATLAAADASDTADLSAKAGGAPPTPKATPSPTPPAGSYDPFDDEVLFDEDGFVKRAEDEPAADTSAGAATNSTADDDEKDPNERPLPHEWLPSAGACVALFLAATAHALFYLMLRWSIDFKVRVFFAPSRRVVAGSYVCFKPLPNKGKPALERVCRSARTDKLIVEFQRQKYEVLSAAAARAADGGADLVAPDTADAAVVLIPSPVALPCAEYAKASGLSSKDDVPTRTELYGPNILSVRTPRFVDMYVEQLLSPLVIFQVTARRVSPAHSSVHVSAHILAISPPQIFCSFLWLLDAVSLGFTAFQFVSILLLESTSVFQRQRTFKTLNGMSAKPTPLQVSASSPPAPQLPRRTLPRSAQPPSGLAPCPIRLRDIRCIVTARGPPS